MISNDSNWPLRPIDDHQESFEIIWSHLSNEATKLAIYRNATLTVLFCRVSDTVRHALQIPAPQKSLIGFQIFFLFFGLLWIPKKTGRQTLNYFSIKPYQITVWVLQEVEMEATANFTAKQHSSFIRLFFSLNVVSTHKVQYCYLPWPLSQYIY